MLKESERLEKEKKLNEYIKQKLGKRKRYKGSDEQVDSSDSPNSITDFFDRSDKRKKKNFKITSTLLSNKKDNIEYNKKEALEKDNKKKNIQEENSDEFEENNLAVFDGDNLNIFEEDNSDLKNDNHNPDDDIKDNLFESSSSDEEERKKTKNIEFENIKNKINNLVPNLIDEINKKLDTQKAFLDKNDELTNINNKKKKNNENSNNKSDKKDMIEDDEILDMSLDSLKKIHITFYGYKLMPNNQFVRIYPLTLEVPETAKFKTIFKAYCAGTSLNEEEMLFNYNNIEIFSTSTLKGLNMTSSLENYRIDVFFRVEYSTYKYQLKVQQILNEELQKEKEKKKIELEELNFHNNFQDQNFDDEDDDEMFSNDRNINIIIQDKNKKEIKISINKNKKVENFGLIYIEKLSLDRSLLPKLSFYFDGQKLDNNQTIKELDIENQDIVDVKIED